MLITAFVTAVRNPGFGFTVRGDLSERVLFCVEQFLDLCNNLEAVDVCGVLSGAPFVPKPVDIFLLVCGQIV